MVKHKKALEKLWADKCDVIVQQKQTNPITKRTEFVETTLYTEQPCKLSFEKLLTVTENGNVPAKSQRVILFIGKDVIIPTGSKIIIYRGDNTFSYKNSSESAIFNNHQEVFLELFEGWA